MYYKKDKKGKEGVQNAGDCCLTNVKQFRKESYDKSSEKMY